MSTALITNARILTHSGVLDSGWVHIEGQTIVNLGAGPTPMDLLQSETITHIDAAGQWLVPGFIDIHVHGADGADVMDGKPKSIEAIGRFHATHGTTGWLPTTLTAAIDRIEQSVLAVDEVSRMQAAKGPVTGAAILGLHLEGPFISPHKLGAQNPEYVHVPSIDVMQRLTALSTQLIKKVTLAPERDGALALIRWLRQHEIIASIGHTDGTYEETMKAVESGATHATHLFNAMRGLHHRDAGVVGACLLSNDVVCELVADGYHVDTSVMKLLVRTKGTDGIVLITDAISATGKPDGAYQLGGLNIILADGKSVLEKHGALAGSTLTMDQAVRNMMQQVGVTLHDAVRMASSNPARELGLAGKKGGIDKGADADIVLLDEAMTVTRTFVQGREVFCR